MDSLLAEIEQHLATAETSPDPVFAVAAYGAAMWRLGRIAGPEMTEDECRRYSVARERAGVWPRRWSPVAVRP